uniref:Alpha-2C adrenergic receptor n=1 Tax=Aceria tosichella TaxID=561515 RepID=A0A6G1S3S5_9ACAR
MVRPNRMLSLGGVAIAAAAAAAATTAAVAVAAVNAAANNSSNDYPHQHHHLQSLASSDGARLARRGLSPLQQQQRRRRQQPDEKTDAATAVALNDPQLQDQDIASRLSATTATTTIATSSEQLSVTAGVTQAFDNSQTDRHWMIDQNNTSHRSSQPGAIINRNNATSQSSSSTDEALIALVAATPSQLQLQQLQQQQQQLQVQPQQQSFSDWWQEYWSRQPFPSGYTQSSITLVACLLTTIIFLIVVGNLLVCIAIFTEKSLKPTQNWFIASLAVSDMLLGLVVMPFSLARELMGFWIFGPLWCDIHEALDVLLTTASINTLCLISLDRYWSITQAVSYLKKRTPRRAVFMIAFVWVFSAAVSLPPLFGWKKQSPTVTAPVPIVNSNSSRLAQIQQAQQKNQNNNQRQRSSSSSSSDREQRDEQYDEDDELSATRRIPVTTTTPTTRTTVDSLNQGNQGEDATGETEPGLNGGGGDEEESYQGNDESASLVGQEQQRQWHRKRRRRYQANSQPRVSSSSSATSSSLSSSSSSSPAFTVPSSNDQRRKLIRANGPENIPDSLQRTAAMSSIQQMQQLQQPVIPYAYLSSEQVPQLQAEQQLQQQQTNEYPTCQLSDDVGYVLYSALGSFFIPCAVMVFTYIKIGLAARKRARRAINKQSRAGGAGGAKRGASGGAGLQRRTIAGTTSGRASKQQPVGDSALLLAPTLTTGVGGGEGAISENQFLDESDPDRVVFTANQRRTPKGLHHHHRNSRAGIHQVAVAASAAAGFSLDAVQNRNQATPTPPMMGKLVVVERQKVTQPLVGSISDQQQEVQPIAPIAADAAAAAAVIASTTATSRASVTPPPMSPEASSDQDLSSACCAATLITSGSKLASPSALKCSSSCGGISSIQQQQQKQKQQSLDQQQAVTAVAASIEQPEAQLQHLGQRDRKPTNESNDSSLITVMSASMNELPQVTRFNFSPTEPAGQAPSAASASSGQVVIGSKHERDEHLEEQEEQEKQRATALLRAISRAGRELANDETLAEVIGQEEYVADESQETQKLHPSEIHAAESHDLAGSTEASQRDTPTDARMTKQEQQQQPSNNSTNETCFMTIEEDSDHLEAQTGRTIMMIASNAKQSSCSLAGKSQKGIMMTMLPPALGSVAAQQQQNDTSTIVCNNVACLRRHARRQANRRRRGSSYCGSSMTINDDDDEEEEDDDEEDEEEEEDDDDDDMIANGDDSVDEDDECLDDDVLTDDCNGYSGSCRLDPYCTGATGSTTCVHCRECPHDSPLSCVYNYSKSTPPNQDSPRLLHGSGGCISISEQQQQQTGLRSNNKRTSRRFVSQHAHHHNTRSSSVAATAAAAQNSQDGADCSNISEIEAQSLTGDDNLSLTDYYRNNEDNSSIVGHDVLDATPAREYLGPKRRSLVASAIASVGGGINRMTSGGSSNQQQLQQQQQQQQPAQMGTTGRKKSSIGFHLARFGSGSGVLGGGASSGHTYSNPPAGGGLLALAAASQQQNQQQVGGGNATRNLKTLRQNFFHKLNQLTAKSAAKQQDNSNKLEANKCRSPTYGKSSAHSSYGSSYEPSVDCATTSNLHSTNDQYQMETTLGETDEYEAQTSAETTKQSSDQISSGGAGGRRDSPVGKLMSIAQQAAAAATVTTMAAAAAKHTSSHPMISSKDVQPKQNQRSHQAHKSNSSGMEMINNNNNTTTNTNNNKRIQLMSAADEDESNVLAQSSSQISLTTEGERNMQTSFNVDDDDDDNGNNNSNRQTTMKLSHDRDQRGALTGNNNNNNSSTITGLGVKRRSKDKVPPGTSLSLVCSSQIGASEHPRATGTNATFRLGAGGTSSGTGGGGSNVISKAFLASDNERHKRKLAKARERRATLILGLIMATFISCWFPFFTFYVLRAICHVCRDYIPPRLEAFIFWMGYCNSAINPIIYTIFNRDFRKAFRKILFRCSRE